MIYERCFSSLCCTSLPQHYLLARIKENLNVGGCEIYKKNIFDNKMVHCVSLYERIFTFWEKVKNLSLRHLYILLFFIF